MDDEILTCPFCGSGVTLMSLTMPIKMFYCNNHVTCGAIVSFDNKICNTEDDDKSKIACFNRRTKVRRQPHAGT